MAQNPSALASLTANYTDSENEDGQNDDSDEENSNESQVYSCRNPNTTNSFKYHNASHHFQVIILSRPTTPIPKVRSAQSTPSKTTKSGLRLVSYHDDTIISDEENESDSPPHALSPMANINRDDGDKDKSSGKEDDEEAKARRDRFAEYGFQLPPEPRGKCPTEAQEKISEIYKKMRDSHMNMNQVIQGRKEFRNPSIYEKLIQFCDIDELGTNYQPELYDPMQWISKFSSSARRHLARNFRKPNYFSVLFSAENESFFYEELSKVQKAEMDKREKELSKNEAFKTTVHKTEDESKKRYSRSINNGNNNNILYTSLSRKSKWDQAAPSVSSVQHAVNVMKPSALITTSISGTKGTVISAFGSLPKKPKPWKSDNKSTQPHSTLHSTSIKSIWCDFLLNFKAK